MDANQRREAIIARLRATSTPVSASVLGKELHVSRQIVVGDVALLRAASTPILATNRGYLLAEPSSRPRRTLLVQHDKSGIATELHAIVGARGTVIDAVVDHRVYGPITVDLMISTPEQVDELARRFADSSALLELANGWHYHTVEAETEEVLDAIEARLEELGFLHRADEA